MRRTIARFQRFATLLFCGAVICVTGLASTISTISATAGPNSCGQTSATSVSCNVANGTATASATTTATWGSPGGRLEATSDGFGGSTSASASVSYSNMLIVTGVSGSGDLTIEFTGFQDILSASPAGGTVSPLSVTLGANSTSVDFPGGGTFSATLPVTFGTFLPFTVSFSDSASGTMFHMGANARGDADAALTTFPTFVVTNANGAPIPGGNVGFIPEPATFALLLCAVPALWLVRRGTRGVQE